MNPHDTSVALGMTIEEYKELCLMACVEVGEYDAKLTRSVSTKNLSAALVRQAREDSTSPKKKKVILTAFRGRSEFTVAL